LLDGRKKQSLLIMDAGPIDVYDGEGKAFRAKREGRRNRKIINGVVKELKHLIIPSRNDPT
jgi:hypothetical protein